MRPQTYLGKPLSYWEKKTGIRVNTIAGRLKKGLPHEAIFASVKKASKQTDWVALVMKLMTI